MWEVELAAVLEMDIVGHRRRILVSLEQALALAETMDQKELEERKTQEQAHEDLNQELRKLVGQPSTSRVRTKSLT